MGVAMEWALLAAFWGLTNPSPAPPVPPAPVSVPALLERAASRYGLSAARLTRLANCESSLNPNAVGAGGHAKGLFQFIPRTWAWASHGAGYGGWSVFDAEASAMTAAWLIAQPGGGRHWVSCGGY